jgi:hypothetical protein
LRLLLLRTFAGLLRLTRTATSTTPSALARSLLFALRLRLRRSRLLLLLPIGARTALLLLLRLPALLFLLPLTLAVALTLSFARLLLLRPLVLPRLPAGALLELAHLLLHVSRRLPLLLEAQLVVAAVRAALPSLGIALLTCGAKDAFRERHREIGAHCTLRAVDESRRRTLLTLIHLAEENSASACWDDRRAMELLRKEATAEELRELGMDEQLIAHVFAEEHAR